MDNLIKAVRGTRDILPPDTALWQYVEQTCRNVFHRYNFHEIRTPIFEDKRLFERGVGEETDIVSKELYAFPEGAILESDLKDAWKKQYAPDYEIIRYNVELANHQLDIVAYKENTVTVVEIKNRVNAAVVNGIRTYYETLKNAFEPWQTLVVALAAPSFELDKLKGLGSIGVQRGQGQGLAGIGKNIVNYQPLIADAPSTWLALRPENTAGVVRAYVEHHLVRTGELYKLYYIGPQFRRERPQKGRYRQFYQIGAEVLGPPSAGSESPARDAEIIAMLADLLEEVGIKDWQLHLNSIGCADDRAKYNLALREALAPIKDQLCTDCRRRAETNPLRVLDCKVPGDQDIINDLPKISEFLDEPCRNHFKEVRRILSSLGIKYHPDDRMVRGLDYYTRTIFEFTHRGLGAQSALLGGGRYDGLAEALGGRRSPGIGFALGLDRFALALQAEKTITLPDLSPIVYVAPQGPGMNVEAAKIAHELRLNHIATELGDETFSTKKCYQAAERTGARFVLVVSDNEVSSGQFTLKNLSTGEQAGVSLGEIAGIVKPRSAIPKRSEGSL